MSSPSLKQSYPPTSTSRSLRPSLTSLAKRKLREQKTGGIKPFPAWLPGTAPASWRWDWPYLRLLYATLDGVTAGDTDRLMLTLPPRHGKSSLVTIRYAAWTLCRAPITRIVIGGYNQNLAESFSRQVRRLVEQRIPLAPDSQAVGGWETQAGGGVRAVGVGGGITGHGADLVVIDDPVKSREEAESLAYRDRCWNWYTDDIYSRLEPGARIVLIMTRWHEDDLAGRIFESEEGSTWSVLHLPALAEADDTLGRPVGEALCPDRYDVAALERTHRTMGDYAFNALYQGRPSPAVGNLFQRGWWRYYTEEERARIIADADEIIISGDLAFKGTQDSDYVVLQVWARIGARKYLLEQVRGQWDFPTTCTEIVALAGRWPQYRAIYIEDAANGPAVIQSLQRMVSGLVAVRPEGGKVARAAAATGTVQAGDVYLPEPESTPWSQ